MNDFNQFGRTWQVNVQADTAFRMQPEDVRRLQVRNDKGQMVPLGAVAMVESVGGPFVITRYNMYPAAAINGGVGPGIHRPGDRQNRAVWPTSSSPARWATNGPT